MYNHGVAASLLTQLDLGSSVAEQDNLLEAARVETAAFTDLLNDKADLIPGTKGSGKSSLFRLFVDILPHILLGSKKIVIAHGVNKQGDSVFLAFKEQFESLTEDDFISFWCIYLTSLAHEQFIKGEAYQELLAGASDEISVFRRACQKANIPEIKAKKSLKDILAWTLNVLQKWKPRLRYVLPNEAGEVELDIFGTPVPATIEEQPADVPIYVSDIKDALERVLEKADLSMWLMVDRLDEIFPRRTQLEANALRGLLRATKLFSSKTIRVKIFLRDDMLEEVLEGGFTALTHLTARQADTLSWSEEQIVNMLVKRIFANEPLRQYLSVDKERLDISQAYRNECFYKVFPPTVHSRKNQSPTSRWIYNHAMDGKGIVTPRDVLDLVTRAQQAQQATFLANPSEESPWLIGPQAIQYGFEELSKRRRDTYLRAEFPHLWEHIQKFQNGKSEYTVSAMQTLLGKECRSVIDDLVSVGFLQKRVRKDSVTYWIPYLYRKGLEITQGKA